MAAAVDSIDGLDTTEPRRLGHVPGLDGVRALAVLLVIAFHWGFLWRADEAGLVPGGYIGVDVFFVLSGFLITSILVGEKARTGGVSFKRFYIRRSLRLMPALAVLLAAHVAYTIWQGDPLGEEAKQVLAVALYVANFAQIYFIDTFRPGLVVMWSLAIEEQFYLVWPAVLLLFVLRVARTRQFVIGLILGGAVLSALIRIFFYAVADDATAAHIHPAARADGLLIGAACAFLWRWRMVPTKWLSPLASLSVVGLIGFAVTGVVDEEAMYMGGYAVVSIASALIILAVVENVWRFQPVAEWGPLRLIGKVSYGLYLWHTLGARIAGELADNEFVVLLLGAVITAAAVTASWLLVETPALRLKERLTDAPRKPSTTGSEASQ